MIYERVTVADVGRVMFSSAEESFGSAVRELREAFGGNLAIERLGPDLGVLAATAPTVGEVADACHSRPLVFVRHLTVELARVPRAEATDLGSVVREARAVVSGESVGPELAVQTWVSGPARVGYGSGELRAELVRDLADHGFSVGRAGKPQVLSCCITADGVAIGLNQANQSLSDWPGGRVRLARDQAQVSRAEFKLEELFQTFPVTLPARGRAVDLGASPGGWTRILRQQGMTVWAVDPGDLHPSVATDPDVHHFRTTAGQFFRSTDMRFDVLANDMRMDPEMSCRVVLDAAQYLRPGGLAIVTLKTGTHTPVAAVQRCPTLLRRSYDIEHARQLHHNRHEVSVVARRRGRR